MHWINVWVVSGDGDRQGRAVEQDEFCTTGRCWQGCVTHSLLCTYTGSNRHRTQHPELKCLSPLESTLWPYSSLGSFVLSGALCPGPEQGKAGVSPLLADIPALFLNLEAKLPFPESPLSSDTEASLQFLKSGGSGGKKHKNEDLGVLKYNSGFCLFFFFCLWTTYLQTRGAAGEEGWIPKLSCGMNTPLN